MKNILLLLLILVPVANASEQLKSVSYVEGSWQMSVAFYEDGQWAEAAAPVNAVAEAVLNSSFIRMNTPVSFPGAIFQFEMTLSYDQFNQVYRLAFLDDVNGFMDIYTGHMKDGVLSVTNLDTGTAFPDGEGGFVYGKVELSQSDQGFQINAYTSTQVEAPFAPYMKMEFLPTN